MTLPLTLFSRCILLKFYIKPQLRLERELAYCVVSYWNSTSNHNYTRFTFSSVSLYLIEILHQTTTTAAKRELLSRCILLKFYIKPQLLARHQHERTVVSYWNSTSNHNPPLRTFLPLLVVSYWNSTSNHNYRGKKRVVIAVVSYWNSTSNHNLGNGYPVSSVLYLIEILHQTTTLATEWVLHMCCILLKFYIKPQLAGMVLMLLSVVSYWNSTSNHNGPRT